jgi:periplasmic divalent cation tolerance protein
MKADDYILVMSTVSSQLEAGRIGEELINRKLAACVNIVPGITSYYRWGGNAQIGRELMLLIKTRSDNYKKVQEVIKEHHSYELPEVIALPIGAGDEQYLKWIDESSGGE